MARRAHTLGKAGLLISILFSTAIGAGCVGLSKTCIESLMPGYVYGPLSSLPVNATAQSVSVVIMNWSRPENVKIFAERLVTYNQVLEVIIVMNNPATRFEMDHERVVILDLSGLERHWGVAVRFKACLLAESKLVLALDDDMDISEHGLQRMLEVKVSEPDSLIAYYGRSILMGEHGPEYGGDDFLKEGRHDIALTKALLLDFRFCDAFFTASHLMKDLSHEAKVTWNGEDIFMSLVGEAVMGQKAIILERRPDDIRELSDGLGIHQTDPGHYAFRTRFLQTAISRLSC